MRRPLALALVVLLLAANACGSRSALDAAAAPGAGGSTTSSSTTATTVTTTATTTSSSASSTGGPPLVACHPGDPPVVLAADTGADSLAIDEGFVYFGGTSFSTLGRVPKLGGDVEIIDDHQLSVWFLAVDAKRVYWSNTCGVDGCGVLSADKTGGGTSMLAAHHQASAIAVDDASVYWLVDWPSTPELAGTVQRAPKEGGAATTLVSDLQHPWGIALDDHFVYWVDEDSGLLGRVPKGGGKSETIVNAGVGAWGLAVDGTRVYWSLFADYTGFVASAPKSGGQATKLATDLDSPGYLIVDADNVYVSTRGLSTGSPPMPGGKILRIPKDGGPATVLADNQLPESVAVDDACVYWANLDGSVMRAPK